jgi:signal transduction histidine kinase
MVPSSSQDTGYVSARHCKTYSNDGDDDEALNTDERSQYETGSNSSNSNVIKSSQVYSFQKKLRHANNQFFGLFLDVSIKRLFTVLVFLLLFVTITMTPSNKARFNYLALVIVSSLLKEVLSGLTTKYIASLNDATFEHDLFIIQVIEGIRLVVDPVFFLLSFYVCGPACPLYVWGVVVMIVSTIRVEIVFGRSYIIPLALFPNQVSILLSMYLVGCSLQLLVTVFCVLVANAATCYSLIYMMQKISDYTNQLKTVGVLKKNQQLYKDLYIHAPNMFLSVDPKSFKIINCNEAVTNRTNFSSEEILNFDSIFELFHEESRSSILNFLTAKVMQLSTKNKAHKNDSIEVKMRTNGNCSDELIVAVNVSSIMDHSSNIQGHRKNNGSIMLLILHDITEQRKLHSEFEIAKEQAIKSDRAKTDFIATMNHELRTPLNGVIGTVDFILKDIETLYTSFNESDRQDFLTTCDRLKENLRIIQSSSKLLLGLVNNILDFSRLMDLEIANVHSKKSFFVLEPRAFNIRQMLREAASCVLFIHALPKKLNYSVKIQHSIPQILIGDLNRIQQVVLNLLSNALKFTKEGSILMTVDVISEESQRDKSMGADGIVLNFSIKDTGCGIKEEQFGKLFQKFSQIRDDDAPNTVSTRIHEGSGLGLFISRKLVDYMGGKLEVQSRYGVGSTFSFTVPLKITETKPEQVECYKREDDYDIIDSSKNRLEHTMVSVIQPTSDSSSSSNEKYILLAEDNLINRLIMEKILAQMKKKCLIAQNGLECVSLYTSSPEKFSLILLDLFMPYLSGYDAAKQIRSYEKERHLKRIPIIAVTANVCNESQIECLEAGMDDYIAKPVTPVSVEKIVQKYLETHI